MITIKSERFFTVKEAAVELGLCAATIYKMLEQGELPHIRIGKSWRLPKVEVEKWVNGNLRGANH
jgi:excisionase family DNA binding protein